MKTLILDCETTGVSNTDQVIELAYYEVDTLAQEKERTWNSIEDEIMTFRYFPSVSIHERAYAVHGLGLSMLTSYPPSASIELPESIDYIIGHNITFDKRMIGNTNPALKEQLEQAKYICTLALSKSISKFLNISYENNQLDTLAKHYYPEFSETLVTPLHSAKNDVLKTLLVLLKLVEHVPTLETFEDIYNFQTALKESKK